MGNRERENAAYWAERTIDALRRELDRPVNGRTPDNCVDDTIRAVTVPAGVWQTIGDPMHLLAERLGVSLEPIRPYFASNSGNVQFKVKVK